MPSRRTPKLITIAPLETDTKIGSLRLAPEPAEKHDERPPTVPQETAAGSQLAAAETGTEIVRPKTAPEPAGMNGEYPLTAQHDSREDPWQGIFVPGRKIAGRKPIHLRGNKPAGLRQTPQSQDQELRRLRFRNLKFVRVK